MEQIRRIREAAASQKSAARNGEKHEQCDARPDQLQIIGAPRTDERKQFGRRCRRDFHAASSKVRTGVTFSRRTERRCAASVTAIELPRINAPTSTWALRIKSRPNKLGWVSEPMGVDALIIHASTPRTNCTTTRPASSLTASATPRSRFLLPSTRTTSQVAVAATANAVSKWAR